MSFYGIGTNYNYLFGSMSGMSSGYGSHGRNSMANLTSSMFSNVNLSDYALIRSGSYGKLMKSYYGDSSSSVKESINKITQSDTTDKKALSLVKSSASKLADAALKLTDAKLYKSTGVDDKGEATYDYDSIYEKVSSFVNEYNSTLDSLDGVDTRTVLSKGVNIVQNTSANENMLGKIGISIGEGNELSIDKEKFMSASINDITTMFSGFGSYAGYVASKSTQMSSLASSNMAMMSATGSAYTSSGMYYSSGISTYQGFM